MTKDDRRARAESIKTLRVNSMLLPHDGNSCCGSSRNPSGSQGLTHGPCDDGHQFSLPKILDLRGVGVWTESTVSCMSWLKPLHWLPGSDGQT